MHRDILGVVNDKNVFVDHINHNRIDNRRCNLRLVTKSQNNQNRSSLKNSTSKYLGVYIRKGKWISRIKVNQKPIHLGTFTCETQAALAYNNAAELHFGEYANLNII